MSGGLMSMGQQQPVDEGAFQQALMHAMMAGAAQGDPMSRMAQDAAQRQRQQYEANRWDWDQKLARGEDLPTEDMTKPAWQRGARTFGLMGNNGMQNAQFLPTYYSMGNMGVTPYTVNPNYDQDIRTLFQQYGPMGLMGLF